MRDRKLEALNRDLFEAYEALLKTIPQHGVLRAGLLLMNLGTAGSDITKAIQRCFTLTEEFLGYLNDKIIPKVEKNKISAADLEYYKEAIKRVVATGQSKFSLFSATTEAIEPASHLDGWFQCLRCSQSDVARAYADFLDAYAFVQSGDTTQKVMGLLSSKRVEFSPADIQKAIGDEKITTEFIEKSVEYLQLKVLQQWIQFFNDPKLSKKCSTDDFKKAMEEITISVHHLNGMLVGRQRSSVQAQEKNRDANLVLLFSTQFTLEILKRLKSYLPETDLLYHKLQPPYTRFKEWTEKTYPKAEEEKSEAKPRAEKEVSSKSQTMSGFEIESTEPSYQQEMRPPKRRGVPNYGTFH